MQQETRQEIPQSDAQLSDSSHVNLTVPTAEDMRNLGAAVAHIVQGGDVVVLSGPLGAGKTTWAQGFGQALQVQGPMVSPTFTIARQLHGKFANGNPATIVHVDAYRLGGHDYAPGEDEVSRLLDELESLGLDELLDSPQADTVVLMEWGEQMAAALAPERFEIHINRPTLLPEQASDVLSADGERTVSINAYGQELQLRLQQLQTSLQHTMHQDV
ncbi:tRNA (adenosine(37)-N6)-threonylcarbamoyltransferase complex ATPase subunit type 1 TsaE [Galliscardovia ingluviei]|uniref:tRNA threonylcarbamoyladenosine biosynthesis protein TsaE n=1 Tax=Galliscardovia ingluviei TaxID=1769422 RepID=A0A8J3EVK8_9BIFI|nr:tRNA (adenosine(37)-N6)-threonylcarbamoyltransferase complex ATPase subunit type 1 TsaE [Galliscardovia ingluviei]GGI13160.1 tRNA (adenosine(37)-N6)-threonylcarbamoyltransferase complex ATPase subunit type 1 TsaE [Galliscardovia ingluviei]